VVVDKAPCIEFPDKGRVADVRDLRSLISEIPEAAAIINLAAEHRDDVRPISLYDEVNVYGARNICAVAEEKRIGKIVFTSSVACYGFAAPDTGEDGVLNPFNDYGRTKAEAEAVYREWQARDPESRCLVIVRPTVIFGEGNRGNVYNLLSQIARRRFIMIGAGRNRKSMAYVENVAAFLQFALNFPNGVHVVNYVDKPDFDMTTLVSAVRKKLKLGGGTGFRIPYFVGYAGGMAADLAAKLTGRRLPVSAVRVKKFCATTQFSSIAAETGFVAPVSLEEGLDRTVRYEFVERHPGEPIFYTE
jgi:nucleoside-diphosphate-sugar epimerase